MIQAIGGVNAGGKIIAATLDIDYADGVPGPDTTVAVYDATGDAWCTSAANRTSRTTSRSRWRAKGRTWTIWPAARSG